MSVNSPFEIDERTRFLGFDLDGEATEYLPYLNLRRIKFSEGSSREKEKIEIHFEFAQATIEGKNLKELVSLIRHETLSILRKGISTDPNHPEISNIRLVFPQS